MKWSITCTVGRAHGDSRPGSSSAGWASASSKFHDWRDRYGKVTNTTAGFRDWWLEDWEKQAILRFSVRVSAGGLSAAGVHDARPRRGGRQPVECLPRVEGGGPHRPHRRTSRRRKARAFISPQKPHEHWHIDISYLNIHGTFYYLTTILDGYSRYIVHWEIRRSMRSKTSWWSFSGRKRNFPNETPRIISDNGSQFLAKDFKEFIRICGMTHVRTSPYYPQSNGKLERFHGSIKGECIRPGTPLSLEDAVRIVGRYVEHYNEVRLHSAIGYVAPADKLAGREAEIFAARDRKLAEARSDRKEQREAAPLQAVA